MKPLLWGDNDMLELNQDCIAELHAALLAAFPNRDGLAQMVAYGLGENINEIAAENQALDDTIFALIAWAQAQGRVQDLVEASVFHNPGNPELRRFQQNCMRKGPQRLIQIIAVSGLILLAFILLDYFGLPPYNQSVILWGEGFESGLELWNPESSTAEWEEPSNGTAKLMVDEPFGKVQSKTFSLDFDAYPMLSGVVTYVDPHTSYHIEIRKGDADADAVRLSPDKTVDGNFEVDLAYETCWTGLHKDNISIEVWISGEGNSVIFDSITIKSGRKGILQKQLLSSKCSK